MTKEELEEEIKNYIDKNCNQWETDGLTADDIIRIAVLDFAESREKQIAELEAQIEKMKNWCNCKNYQQCLIELAEQGKGMKPSECCVNCKKWEIKENA